MRSNNRKLDVVLHNYLMNIKCEPATLPNIEFTMKEKIKIEERTISKSDIASLTQPNGNKKL